MPKAIDYAAQDREFAIWNALCLIDADAFLECYSGAAKRGNTADAERAIMAAAPACYDKSIKLSAIWRKLPRVLRATILADINETYQSEPVIDPLYHACARCGHSVAHSAAGKAAPHKAFQNVCGITLRQECR